MISLTLNEGSLWVFDLSQGDCALQVSKPLGKYGGSRIDFSLSSTIVTDLLSRDLIHPNLLLTKSIIYYDIYGLHHNSGIRIVYTTSSTIPSVTYKDFFITLRVKLFQFLSISQNVALAKNIRNYLTVGFLFFSISYGVFPALGKR